MTPWGLAVVVLDPSLHHVGFHEIGAVGVLACEAPQGLVVWGGKALRALADGDVCHSVFAVGGDIYLP